MMQPTHPAPTHPAPAAAPPHWAAGLIGKPWQANACGPEAFDCRGLVNWCVQLRFGEALPTPETVHRSAWRQVSGVPQADDVVLMAGPHGAHIGFMVHGNGRLGVLHADGHHSAAGPVGAVRFQTLIESTSGGYHRHQFWRHASRRTGPPVDIEIEVAG